MSSTTPLPAPTPRARALGLAQEVLHWTPFSLALLFVGQIFVAGWLPAQRERARVEQAELEVRARADGLAADEEELAEEARMLADPVYQERVRRSLAVPGAAPLTLERARAGSRQ
jgi:hypothetical protein